MTTIEPYEVNCPLCRAGFEQLLLLSTSSHGPPDLDSRPAPLARDTLDLQAAECPDCGYVFEAVPREFTEYIDDQRLRNLVSSAHYRQELARQERPELANRFACRALVARQAGDTTGAGWAMLRAAWACDDAERADCAAALRVSAVVDFEHARSEQPVVEPPDATALLLGDLLRRAGRFDAAVETCEKALRHDELPRGIRDLLGLELRLARKRDAGCHRAVV